MSNYTPQKDIAHFMTVCGQEVKDSPCLPDKQTLLLRCKLNFEENKEIIAAAGCFIAADENGELQVYADDEVKPDIQEIYDGIVDLNYVNYGFANALGVDVQLGHDEVHHSNLTKLHPDGTALKNEFGKVIKGPNYVKPNLKKVLESQVK